jgi:NADH-quinone oxidoreductase subunit G
VAGLFYTLTGANAYAAGLAVDEPVTADQVLAGIEAGRIRGLIAVESNLWTEFPNRQRLQAAFQQLDHAVVLDYIATPLVNASGFFIPTQTIYECGGHWINNEGRLQAADALIAGGEPIEFTGAGDHPPRVFEKRIPGSGPLPAWQAVLTLAGDGGDRAADGLETAMTEQYPTVSLPLSADVGRRISLPTASAFTDTGFEAQGGNVAGHPDDRITLLLVDGTFGTETLSSLSPPLTTIGKPPLACLHPDTIDRLGLTDHEQFTVATGGSELTVLLQADTRVAPGVIVVPRHRQLDWRIFEETCVTLDGSQLKAARKT